MPESIEYHADLAGMVQPPETGIASRVVLNRPHLRSTVFALDAGAGMEEHRAKAEAALIILAGEGELDAGGQTWELKPGAYLVMPPEMPHSLRARTRLVFVLELIKE
jgi:quercetin dioxygenase-like cupin family protein